MSGTAESRWSSFFLQTLDADTAFKPYGPYTVLCNVRVGDHVAVRSVMDGQNDVAWHHGIYVGDDNIVHMHPVGIISKVPFDRFMGNILSEGGRIDAAGIVEYRGDSDAHRLRSAFIAELATQDPAMQSIVCNENSRKHFATWCRVGRSEMTALQQILGQVAATVQIHPPSKK